MNEVETQKLTFTLSKEEANTIIEALGQLPFKNVYKIIEKIHLQANSKTELDKAK